MTVLCVRQISEIYIGWQLRPVWASYEGTARTMDTMSDMTYVCIQVEPTMCADLIGNIC